MGCTFYSIDKEFARQFTQTGQEKEVKTKKISDEELSELVSRQVTYALVEVKPKKKK